MSQYFSIKNFGGINTKVNPLLQPDGSLLTSVNLASDPIGAKTKRGGLEEFLDNPDNSQVNNLFTFSSGTLNYLYRMSGTICYYYEIGGTADSWTPVANGTFTGGGRVGHTTLYDTMILGNGLGSTRHTTNGTSFTNTSLAPLAPYWSQLFGRVYAANDQTLFWSSANDATNWQTSGTSDSSSIQLPGGGTANGLFSTYNRIIASKSSGIMHRWDSFSREQVPGNLAPTSDSAVADMDDLKLYANRLGIYSFTGNYPKLISRPIEKQFYNQENTGIPGTLFSQLAGGEYQYNYYLSQGSFTDPMTGYSLDRAVAVYDYLNNQYGNYQWPILPTAYGEYIDENGQSWQLIAGTSGQVYRVNPTLASDSGEAIEAYMEGFSVVGKDYKDKKIYRAWVHTNPGCQAKLQISMTNNIYETTRKWFDVGDLSRGVTYVEFPQDMNRGKYLFYRFYESSSDTPWTIYGITFEFDYVGDM